MSSKSNYEEEENHLVAQKHLEEDNDLFEGLKLATQNDWYHGEVESDSKVVIKLILGDTKVRRR